MENLASLKASQAANAVKQGRITSVDLVKSTLVWIEKENPALNAVVTLDAERARKLQTPGR